MHAQSRGLMASPSRSHGAYISFDIVDVPASDLDQLKATWNLVFERFEALRTRIVATDDHGALQTVMRQQPSIWRSVSNVELFICGT